MTYRLSYQQNFLRSLLTAAFVALGITLGCSTTYKELEQTDDRTARILLQTKSSLIQNEGVDAAAIKLAIEGNAIILSGFVETEREAQLAESITIDSNPEFRVVNQLEVK